MFGQLVLSVILFNAALLATCVYAAIRGGDDERLTAGALFVATYASIPSTAFWSNTEFLILLVDLLLFAFLLWLMARSDRFWPIWATGFHAPAVFTHVAVTAYPKVAGFAYATYVIIWSYFVMATLVTGTFYEVVKLRRGGQLHPV